MLLVSGNAPPFVESLLRRLAPALPVDAADVPLAEQRRRIAEGLQRFGDGHLPQRHSRREPLARPHGVAAREQRDAGNDARILHVEVRSRMPSSAMRSIFGVRTPRALP